MSATITTIPSGVSYAMITTAHLGGRAVFLDPSGNPIIELVLDRNRTVRMPLPDDAYSIKSQGMSFTFEPVVEAA